MLLNDEDIRKYCTSPVHITEWGPMVEPFSEAVSGGGVIGYGLTSCGYDVRLDNEIWCLKSTFGEIINPKRFKEPGYRERVMDRREYQDGDMVIVPATGYILGTTREYFRIPRHLAGRCVGKSTYARCAIYVNVTPLEPEWEGQLTLEIGNSGPSPVGVFVGEGIAQIQFEVLTARPLVSYRDKGGKYNRQRGVTPAKVL